MVNYELNRPDPNAMNLLLSREWDSAGGTIVRLAWYLGLMRGEIRTLSWSQVDFEAAMVRLSGRNVPIPPDMLTYLTGLQSARTAEVGYVVASEKGLPFTDQYISKLARQALDRVGQTSVRLIDLRHDYVLRQLFTHDWQYVSQVSGIGLVSLRDHFMPHVGNTGSRAEPDPCRAAPDIDREKIARLIESEHYSPAGTLVCLASWVGLPVGEMQRLTWRQVILSKAAIDLSDRTVPIPPDALRYLIKLKAHDAGRSEYVVISKRAGKPLESAYLSKTARAVLVSNGIRDVTLSDLRADFIRRTQVEPPVLALAKRRGGVTRTEAAELLGFTRSQAYARLSRMVDSGKLVRVGSRYFSPEQTAKPARHRELILEYLQKEGSAVRQDFARLLNILPRQVYPILRRLVLSGEIALREGRYYLSAPQEQAVNLTGTSA